MIKTLLAGVGLLSIVAVSAVAVNAYRDSGYRPQPRSLGVNFTELDLDTPRGIAALEARIGGAIDEVCRNDDHCRIDAYAGTRPQVADAIEGRGHAGRAPIGDYGRPAVFSLEPQLADLPSDERGWVEGPLFHAFETGQRVSWESWPRKGYVSVSQGASYDGVVCRNVSITRYRHHEYEPIAEGLRCMVPNLLPEPHGKHYTWL